MAGKEQRDWYGNKELFEMIQGLKEDLQETRIAVQKYNGLRKDLADVMKRLADIEKAGMEEKGQRTGKKEVGISIREWTAWAVAILSLITTILVATGVI